MLPSLNVTVPVGIMPVPAFATVTIRMMGSLILLPPVAVMLMSGVAGLTVTSLEVTDASLKEESAALAAVMVNFPAFCIVTVLPVTLATDESFEV